MYETATIAEVYRGRQRDASWSRVAHGLYAARSQQRDLARELRAWSLTLPVDASFSHLTSARLRGWWLPQSIPHPVFAAAQVGATIPRRSGLVVTRHPESTPWELIGGVRVATAPETLLAAARDLQTLDLVLMGDSALRLNQTTISELEAISRQRRRGAPRLRTILPLLDARSESAWESIMRVVYRSADIPIEPQYEIFDRSGRFVGRADFLIIGTRHLHEYDGADHRGREAHRHDLRRARLLADEGWQRTGLSSEDLTNDAARIIASADELLQRAWDGRRLKRWNKLIADSCCSSSGRMTVMGRWGYAGPPKLSTDGG